MGVIADSLKPKSEIEDVLSGNAQPSSQVPARMRQIGTSNGRPVFEDSTGKRFVAD